MNVKPPQIQGIRDTEVDDMEKKAELEETMEQVAQMDMVKPVPVDEVTDLADIAAPSLQQTNAEASQRVKNRITEKQQAALAKARQAKLEKKKIEQLQGYDAAKGTPAPDLLEKLYQKMESVTEMLQDLKQKQDMYKYRGEESSLQQNHIVEPHKAVEIPDEVQSEERVLRPVHANPKTIPLTNEAPVARSTPGPIVDDANSLTHRLKRALSSISMQNEPMSKRIAMDPSTYGYIPSSSSYDSKVILF